MGLVADLSSEQAESFGKEQEEAAQRLQWSVLAFLQLTHWHILFRTLTKPAESVDLALVIPAVLTYQCGAGPRTAKGIADALTSALPASQISKVKDAKGFSNFTSATSLPKVVLFTDKSRTSALYKSLSLRFKDRLAFAEVSSKAADVVEAQGITQVPKLVVMKTDQVEEYSGEGKFGSFRSGSCCSLSVPWASFSCLFACENAT